MSDEKISVRWFTDEPLLPDAGVAKVCDMDGNPVADVLFERDGSVVKIFGVPR